MDLKWFENLDYTIYVNPRKIDEDNQYFPALKERYSEILTDLKKNKAPDYFIKEVTEYTARLENTIEEYYSGNIIRAQTIINEMIKGLIDDSTAVSYVADCAAFKELSVGKNEEIQFFRARPSDEYQNFSSDDMLHIPFNKRSIIKSGRFSIPGLPCMYLGNTSYDCWIETGFPSDNAFNVSAVRLDNTQKVFNLAVSFFWIHEELRNNGFSYDENKFINMFRLLLLTISTSYVVSEKNRYFKSEYILSQLMMLACKDCDIDGVVYYSKRVKYESVAVAYAVNVALFAVYESGRIWSPRIMDHVRVGNSINFGLYKKLSTSLKEKRYDLVINHSEFVRNITLNDNYKMQVPYSETDFYGFDNFLYCNFDNCLF